MSVNQHNAHNLDDVRGATPAADPPQAQRPGVNYEKIAVWVGVCMVPWVVIAVIVWAFFR